MISDYELGGRKPSLKVPTQLANIFQVSSYYLLGINHSYLQNMELLSYEETLAIQNFVDIYCRNPMEEKFGQYALDYTSGRWSLFRKM